MENSSVLIIVIASIAAVSAVFALYAIMIFKGIKKEGELQLTTKNVLEQVKILYDKKEYPLVELLATKYLERIPEHFEVRKYLVKAFFQEGKHNNAIKHSQIILNKNNKDMEILKIYADCYVKKEAIEKAISIYEVLLEKRPKDIELIKTLADLYRTVEDTYSAIATYNLLRDNIPESDTDMLAEIYSILAELNETAKDFPAAYNAYKARLDILPSDIETNKKFVDLHIKLKNIQKAIEVLLYMLTFTTEAKDLQWVYERLVDLYTQEEKYQSAIDYLEKLLEFQGVDKFQIRFNIAKYKIILGKFDEGIPIYEDLLILSPMNAEISIALAEAHISCKNYKKALEYYMSLLDQSSSKEVKTIRFLICDLYIQWAKTSFEEKKFIEMEHALENAKEYNLINPEIYYYLALRKIANKNYQDSIESLQTALDYDKTKTNHIKYLLEMANVQHELGNQFEEKKAITDLLKIDTDNIQGLLRIGIMYFSQQDTKSAEEYFKRVLALDSNCDDAKYNLALIYETNNPDKAKELYIDILEHNPDYKEAKISLDELSSSNYY